jgi:hypothetical protein
MQNQRAAHLSVSSLIALALLIFPFFSLAADTGVPPFIKVGSSYEFQISGHDLRLTVLAVIGDGWIEVKLKPDAKPFYLNLRDIRIITPVE